MKGIITSAHTALKSDELYLGKGMKIDYEFVDSIPHEASGKFVFSKSKVAQEMFR